MAQVKITQGKVFGMNLNGKSITMSISNTGITWVRRFKKHKHTVRITWDSLDKDFMQLEQDTLKQK